jgi:hypothetical protein
MSLTVTCTCGLKYKVREDKRGKTFACKGCDAIVVIPAAEPKAAVAKPAAKPKPDDEFAEFEDLDLKEFGADDDEWADVPTGIAPAASRRKSQSELESQPRKAASKTGKRKRRPAVEEPEGSVAKALMIGGAGLGAVLLLTVVFMAILIQGARSNNAGGSDGANAGPATGGLLDPNAGAPQAGAGGGGAQKPRQKVATPPEKSRDVRGNAAPPFSPIRKGPDP